MLGAPKGPALDARAHAPLIEGALILLLVHGVIDVLVVVPAGGRGCRGLRLAQDARDVLYRLQPPPQTQSAESACPTLPAAARQGSPGGRVLG